MINNDDSKPVKQIPIDAYSPTTQIDHFVRRCSQGTNCAPCLSKRLECILPYPAVLPGLIVSSRMAAFYLDNNGPMPYKQNRVAQFTCARTQLTYDRPINEIRHSPACYSRSRSIFRCHTLFNPGYKRRRVGNLPVIHTPLGVSTANVNPGRDATSSSY